VNASSQQNTTLRQVEKQRQITITSVNEIENFESLPLFFKEIMKKITDCNGTLSIHVVEQFLNFAK